MKKSLLYLFFVLSQLTQSQIFINTTASTNNIDPTYRLGSVAIGKAASAVEMLDVNGNIVMPFGSFFWS